MQNSDLLVLAAITGFECQPDLWRRQRTTDGNQPQIVGGDLRLAFLGQDVLHLSFWTLRDR